MIFLSRIKTLKKFDKKYLGHDLKYIQYGVYVCLNCKTLIYKDGSNNHYFSPLLKIEHMLTYSCNEMVIKNIIE